MTKQGKLAFLQLLDRSALDDHVAPGTRLVLGVSGGADSVAMLYAMHYYAAERNLELTTVHINHQLRPEAADEEQFVGNLCKSLGIPCVVRRVDGTAKPTGSSPEEHWRKSRYEQFREVMAEIDAEFLCLGHTVDDLAETFLFHLARGTGLDGLTFAMRKTADGMDILRPLWKTSRDNIENVLTRAGQTWVTDSSNLNTRYNRNLIRQQVVPSLKQINPNVNTAILNVASDIARLLTGQNINSTDTIIQNAFLKLDAKDPVELIGRLRGFVRERTGHALTRRQANQFSGMVAKQATGLVSLGGKNTLVVMHDGVWVCPEEEPEDEVLARHYVSWNPDCFTCEPDAPTAHLSSGNEITAMDGTTWIVTWGLDQPLRFRHRQAGDRVRSKTLARLLIDYKIPWFLRDFALLVVDDDEQIVGVIVARPGDCHALNRRLSPDLNLNWVRKETSHDLG